MIYKRGKRWRVIVYAGRDPITGRKRQKSVSVATRAEAKQAEARLITEVGAGQHRGTSNRTVAELLDRWLEWRQSVRPISPTTVATKRGRPMAASEDRELQGRRPPPACRVAWSAITCSTRLSIIRATKSPRSTPMVVSPAATSMTRWCCSRQVSER
jgi:hypothetical protein